MGGMIELPDPNAEISNEIYAKSCEALNKFPKAPRELRGLLEDIQTLANKIHVEYRPGAHVLPKEKTGPVDWSQAAGLADIVRCNKKDKR